MVTNTILTNEEITNEALIVLQNEVILASRVKRDYDDRFARDGAKIGNAISIRKPARYVVTSGPAASAQATVDSSVPLVLTNQDHVDVEFTTAELTLDLDNFSDRVLKPAMGQLASTIDQNGFAVSMGQVITGQGIYNGAYAGAESLATPGSISTSTGPAAWTGADVSSLATYLNAGARLTEAGAPLQDGKRHIITSPSNTVAIVDSLKTLFQSSQAIESQYLKGNMGVAAGFKWSESANAPVFTNSVHDGAGAITATASQGATTLSLKSFANTDTMLKGTQFVVANVFKVNPQNRQSTGKLQIFTVLETVANDGAGNFANVKVWPTIQSTGATQTISRLPTLNDVVTPIGTSGATTSVALAFHEDAFALGMADLADVSAEGAKCVRVSDKNGGFSLRYVSQYSSQTDAVTRRLDVLYGWQCIRPELAVRVQG